MCIRDSLKGFAEAIECVFPQTEVQLCIVHQIRNSVRFIPDKDVKAFMRDLKKVYRAETKEKAEMKLDDLEKDWGKKYPTVIESWRRNWGRLSNYFQYTDHIRRVVYTTNTIEAFNRQLRKSTKTKGAFTSEQALMKLLYLVQERITQKWNKPVFNWNAVLSELSIIFGDRLRLPGSVSQSVSELPLLGVCLLYTSDAADERSSVDLGGRQGRPCGLRRRRDALSLIHISEPTRPY